MLLEGVHGNILEIAVGAGANFEFYSQGSTVTGLDFSAAMLEKARQAAKEYQIQADLRQTDLDEWEGECQKYDFVVSTLCLCAFEDPVQVIKAMANSCKSNGRLLFMEHGLSKYALPGIVQKWLDPINYKFNGCHINRDMSAIFHSSGVKVLSMKRKLFGIIYLIQAQP
ncbi:methyltransferase [Fulvivirga imtechensis AK7]|uniref:Methyltransferase n=1 Tax=Fulvivirga imtechensis AK7 TaxID=1237149 RepID=L8K1S4_9BACT|nr:methyltransferase [Fulvivirga imtechensis AK7]